MYGLWYFRLLNFAIKVGLPTTPKRASIITTQRRDHEAHLNKSLHNPYGNNRHNFCFLQTHDVGFKEMFFVAYKFFFSLGLS
jgi:hypothetical protein